MVDVLLDRMAISIVADQHPASVGVDSELTWDDFAILVRANSSAEPFLQQLQAQEIPFQFMASQGLFSQPVILDIVSYLKLLDSYAEGTALYRILIFITILKLSFQVFEGTSVNSRNKT